VFTCSSLEGSTRGIREIWDAVLDHRRRLTESGELAEKRRKQALDWMWFLVEDGLMERFHQHPQVKSCLPELAGEVEKGDTAPTVAAAKLLFLLDNDTTV
jgi:LAO/AO transport system kinase